LSSLANFLLSLVVLFAVLAIFGPRHPEGLLVLPLLIAIQFVMNLGFAYLLAAGNVFFRDVQHILGILLTAWYFLTPVLFPVSIVADRQTERELLYLNPMAAVIVSYQRALLDGVGPPRAHVDRRCRRRLPRDRHRGLRRRAVRARARARSRGIDHLGVRSDGVDDRGRARHRGAALSRVSTRRAHPALHLRHAGVRGRAEAAHPRGAAAARTLARCRPRALHPLAIRELVPQRPRRAIRVPRPDRRPDPDVGARRGHRGHGADADLPG
ncbi:MAG: hypothetical protein E6J27_15200, partial [Chloroflexi bacterium]